MLVVFFLVVKKSNKIIQFCESSYLWLIRTLVKLELSECVTFVCKVFSFCPGIWISFWNVPHTLSEYITVFSNVLKCPVGYV